MSQGAGIKASLQQIDRDIVLINNELSQNQLTVLNLKNQRARLSSILQVRIEQTERNFKLDVAKFQEEVQRTFGTHNNATKMLERKVDQIRNSQEELTISLQRIQEKVSDLRETLG